ncbi:hypothetical protein EJ05DRAFT_534070 [Pseudovirgaria hyperparasitica]|uniref:Uncharacterized protein n=1 Tax=Pseudovirgaria hyperparasitica TaxID=470096 RepID=A0A6A6WJD4_9PEZI|nr:uncharacterized protein EJ05DRAFT_534070 [Pseudovirgaria hyperparasitica]KAF2762529.1 hypothetical protein EJ05DRAFT_534070 [Pseudovirgaria hyperparasitica]
MSVEKKADTIKQKAADDGVANPSGAAVAGFAGLYLAFIPVTNYLASTGALESFVQGTARLIPGFSNTLTSDRTIPALSALYMFLTFGATGAVSAAGQAMSRSEGLDNNHPRQHLNDMRGLPLRMRSAHLGLLENFAGYALAAALTQSLAPGNKELINLLGLHVLLKLGVYYPAYLLNIGPPRTFAHVIATSSIVSALWKLAAGA